MTPDLQVDQVLDSWFTDGPTELPDRAVAAIVAGLDAPRPRRMPLLGTVHPGRFSMVAAVVAVLAISAVVLTALPRTFEGPAAALPTTLADWSRVTVEGARAAGSIRSIGSGPRGLVAVTGLDLNGQSRVLFSTDGREWSETDLTLRGESVSVVGTDRGFLLTSSEEGAWTSPNGFEWKHIADDWGGNPDVGGAIVVGTVAGGPGYVSFGNHNNLWYSTDGSDWAPADVPAPPADLVLPDYPDLSADISHVVAVGNHLVATGSYVAENSDATGKARDFVLVSDDGRTWSTVLPDMGDRAGPLQLTAGPNGFLLIGGPLDGDKASTIWQSADGHQWQSIATHDFASGTSQEVRIDDLAGATTGFVAVGDARACFDCAPEALVWSSLDGRSWSELAAGEPFNVREPGRTSLDSVITDGSRFVVGGQHDGQPAIWISGAERSHGSLSPTSTAAITEPSTQPSGPEPAPSSAPATPVAQGACLQFDAPGTYTAKVGSLSVSVAVPATAGQPWVGENDGEPQGFSLRKANCGPDAIGLPLIHAYVVDQVYADACHWKGSAVETPTVSQVVAALQAQRNRDAIGPIEAMVGPYRATRFDLSMPATLNAGDCDRDGLPLVSIWNGEILVRGGIKQVYVADVDGTALAFTVGYYPDEMTTAGLEEIASIIASVRIEP
jgi:hypothetical protein